MVRTISARRLMTLPAIQGEALSDYVFSQYARWIEGRKEYRSRIINCTAKGVILKGIPHAQIETLAHRDGLPDRKSKVHTDTGSKLTAAEANLFLKAMKQVVQQAGRDVERDHGYASLRSPDHVFHSIFAEAEKIHRDAGSLNRYLTLFLVFMNRHIDRAIVRIAQNSSP
jgi:hypothetical protein